MLFRGMSLTDIILFIPVILFALTGHEFAHGFVSYKLGDPTPKYEGRLSLNPFAHLDFTGTLLMLFTGFGWAKPVAINPMYYKNRKWGTVIVAFAGPLANFIMALIAIFIYYMIYLVEIKTGIQGTVIDLLQKWFSLFAMSNISLMVFNLIPIPPLDGSRILSLFLSEETYYKISQYERYSIILIFILSFSGVLSRILGIGINAVLSLMNTIFSLIFGLFI